MPGRRRLIGLTGLGLGSIWQARAAPVKKGDVQPVIAETSRGRVRGLINEGIRSFKGIPYGSPTGGSNRFIAAKPAVPWSGVRDAFNFGPICPQEMRPRLAFGVSGAGDGPMSEDCLVLNIWTPALRDHHKRPVLVWFHGGGFSYGSGGSPIADGTNLARRGDVVVITLNHRLNVFGHLYLARIGGAEFAESGNLGVLDLVAALRWIHINVAEFGGDPGNVTIFGQAGGGAKVSILMGMPQTRGLFHKAIVQSGSHLDGLTVEEANGNTLAFLKAAEVPISELTRLQKLSVDQLLSAMRKFLRGPGNFPVFGPVVDGKFLPRAPWIPDGPGSSANVPMLIGTTGSETTALIGASDPSAFSLDDATLRKRLGGWLPARDIDRVLSGYKKIAPGATPSDIFFAITTARQVRQQAWIQADRKAAQNIAPAWLYELDWQTPVDGGKWKSPNAIDLPFVFDNVAKSETMVGTGREARGLAEQMSAAWLAFARNGNPNNKLSPPWPPFHLPERATMVFDVTSRVINDYRGDERRLLDSLPLYRVVR